ncbi:hypothetical protein MMC14_008914 [Varicellaria rhodocarpa]|nr:hypothetical protein [Varicellaria rhodocarpa]
MPVTIKSATQARKWTGDTICDVESLLKESSPTDNVNCKSIIQSSFHNFDTHSPLHPSKNGFVRAAIAAYCYHHHFTLRPEDIWFAILTQLSLHINAHAEEFRSFFVAHDGKKELCIQGWGSIHSADFGEMSQKMSKLMSTQVVDPELHSWIMPDFSTTTENDRIVASIIMMGAMQKYFSYGFSLLCGIPSVTLLGIRADWEEMLRLLEKLPNLGPEPAQFYALLKPILTRFVSSFDLPDSPETKDFWQKIADQSGGSGPVYISGWITAFCFWDQDGKSLYTPTGGSPSGSITDHLLGGSGLGYSLDDVLYHSVKLDEIPFGHLSVPIKVDDNGTLYKTIMVAGSMGIRIKSSREALAETHAYANSRSSRTGPSGVLIASEDRPATPQALLYPDSLQPESGWIMFEAVGETEESEKAKGEQLGNVVSRDSEANESAGIGNDQIAEDWMIEVIHCPDDGIDVASGVGA